jgi:uncharacterized Zn-binding protein involved in type VI secretion
MPVTVKVNGPADALVHKGSTHTSIATMPDVCKTPSPGGPVPIPYPNVSQSITLAKGTTTVKADGMMAAIKGSEFSLSNGDNAGVAGGVKSSTFMKESTWITYSFDVKLDGKNACRLSDKKFQNHENTVDLGGNVGPAVAVQVNDVKCAIKKCDQESYTLKGKNGDERCKDLGRQKHKCMEKELAGKDKMLLEASFDMNADPPSMWTSRSSPGQPAKWYSAIARSKKRYGGYAKGQVRRPDVVIGRSMPRTVIDAKFPCPSKIRNSKVTSGTGSFPSAKRTGNSLMPDDQRDDYQAIAGDKGEVMALSPVDCANAAC